MMIALDFALRLHFRASMFITTLSWSCEFVWTLKYPLFCFLHKCQRVALLHSPFATLSLETGIVVVPMPNAEKHLLSLIFTMSALRVFFQLACCFCCCTLGANACVLKRTL